MQYDKVQLFCNNFNLETLKIYFLKVQTSDAFSTNQYSSITAVREQCCVCLQRGDRRDRDVESGRLC